MAIESRTAALARMRVLIRGTHTPSAEQRRRSRADDRLAEADAQGGARDDVAREVGAHDEPQRRGDRREDPEDDRRLRPEVGQRDRAGERAGAVARREALAAVLAP